MRHKKKYTPRPTKKGKHLYGGLKRNGGNRTDRGKSMRKAGRKR